MTDAVADAGAEPAAPFGWVGTRPNGSKAMFTGARPRDADFPQIDALATQTDFEAADAAMRTPVLTLDNLRAAKLTALTGACGLAITTGFASSALGAPHTYPSGLVDQQNLAASELSSLLPGLPPD